MSVRIFTPKELKEAPIMDSYHYCQLDNPEYQGQTKMDKDGNYIMYFSCEDQVFGYKHNIYK